jgi:hypothetical protein
MENFLPAPKIKDGEITGTKQYTTCPVILMQNIVNALKCISVF